VVADDCLVAKEDVVGPRLAGFAGGGAEDDDSAELLQRFQRASSGLAADTVEHHVHAVVGLLFDDLGEVIFLIVDGVVTAQRGGLVEFLLRGGGAVDFGAGLAGELDRRGADPAGSGVNQHRLAFLQVAPLVETVLGGEELDGEAGGFLEAQALGDVEQPHRVADGVLRVATATGDHRHDFVANLAADVVADGIDDACDFHPGDVRRRRATLVVAAPLHDVREVDAGRLHFDADLTLAGFRFLLLDDFEILSATELGHLDCFHTLPVNGRSFIKPAGLPPRLLTVYEIRARTAYNHTEFEPSDRAVTASRRALRCRRG